MNTNTTFFQKIGAFIKKRKILTGIIVLAVVIGGYYAVKAAEKDKTVTTYSVAAVTRSTVITTVTGTGQVSADNDEDVTAQVAGTIDAVDVTTGQAVTAGQALAHIDSTDAQQSLESAQLAYNKFVEPPTAADVTSAENSLSESYTSGYNSVTSAMADLLTIKTGLYNQLYSTSGYASNAGPNSNDVHANQTIDNDWVAATASYGKAITAYATAYADFQGSSAESSTSTIATLVGEAYAAASAMAQAVNDTNVLINFLATNDANEKSSTAAADAQSSMQSWSSSVDGDVSSLLSAQNSITSNANALATLVEGPDAIDVQSQELSLTQAQQNYAYTNVVAPFAGIIAKVDVTPDEQVSSGTTIATVVTPDEYATISLNEVDAAKVSVGQKATLTFDAVSGLSIAGTVSEVDGIGTVSQGVVTYNVQIAFDSEDSRVKPGMSVDASIITAADQNVLVVPSAAVKTQGSASYVQELSQKYATNQMTNITSVTAPKNVPVTVGLSDNTNTEIVSGLSEGDQVVIKTTTTSGSAASVKSTATAATTRGGGGFGGGGAAGALRGL